MSGDRVLQVRGAKIAMIFQEPMTSLNPVLTIGRQLTEALETHLGMNREASARRAGELLDLVGIPGWFQSPGRLPTPVQWWNAPARDDCHGP